MHCMRGVSKKHTSWSQTLRSWKIWTRQKFIMPKNGENFMFPVADGTVKLSGRDQVFRRSTWIQGHPARVEEHYEDLQGESDGSQPIRYADGWQWSSKRFLDDRRELHLSSSRWTKSWAPCENKPNTRRPRYARIAEAHESTRKRLKLNQKILRIALLGRDAICWVITSLCTSSFRCPKQWKSRMRKLAKSGEKLDKCQHCKWPESGAKRKSSKSHWKKEEQCILLR